MKKYVNRINAIPGATATIKTFCTGEYHDGTEDPHYVTYDAICIDVTKETAYKPILDMVKRCKSLRMVRCSYMQAYIKIILESDVDRIEKARATAETFLNAYWQALHDGKPEEQAIIDGKQAIKA